ncbi:hypothetical protein WISP_37425 [Willisornis vidua]|uniref:Uncharacterized protein n=1 Tax=Willisornis vidua TaxID=1566151 RepID=A0ABQ9DI15_9PASS|nr:hypothetical protein WISP_37425 [Willisornis vidua]
MFTTKPCPQVPLGTCFLNPSKDGHSSTLLPSPFQCMKTPSMKKFSQISDLNLPWHNMRPFLLILLFSVKQLDVNSLVPWVHSPGLLGPQSWSPGSIVLVSWAHSPGPLGPQSWSPEPTVLVPWVHSTGPNWAGGAEPELIVQTV